MTRGLYAIFLLCCLSNTLFSQTDYANLYGAIDERLLVETKWKYNYSLHVESNTVIHKAEGFYDYFLYFKYDFTYEEFLNGVFSKGTWSLNQRTLYYPFKHINKFEISQINKSSLVLEFVQPNAKGTYQYHFSKVNSADAPFIKPANELPDVIVEELNPRKQRDSWLSLRKKRKRKRKKKKYEPTEKLTYINIELIGGGFYGGVDPILRDYIHIKNDGRLIKEFKSVNKGLQIVKKDISREELEQFAEWVTRQGFFEMERIYDCDSPICEKRKRQKPTPVPLRLAVAYGDRKKVITLSIWGKDNNNVQYMNYPAAIDNIIDAIQKMANRLEPDMVSRK